MYEIKNVNILKSISGTGRIEYVSKAEIIFECYSTTFFASLGFGYLSSLLVSPLGPVTSGLIVLGVTIGSFYMVHNAYEWCGIEPGVYNVEYV